MKPALAASKSYFLKGGKKNSLENMEKKPKNARNT